MSYFDLSRSIASEISAVLIDRLQKTGFLESLTNSDNLKSSHSIDVITAELAQKILEPHEAAVHIESFSTGKTKNPKFSVYIDPVDGSLNWDRGVGDPCVVIAISEKPKIECLDDLSFAYVLGLRSGDEYWADAKKANFRCALTGIESVISCKKGKTIPQSTAYLRPGYGFAKEQLSKTIKLFYLVRDIRAIDNTGMELCEIARGAADILVETRGGSAAFNLLAWPILRAAGGVMTKLSGENLALEKIDIEKQYDYIAAGDHKLVYDAMSLMS